RFELREVLAVVEERYVTAARLGQPLDIIDQPLAIHSRSQVGTGNAGHLGQRERTGALEETRMVHRGHFRKTGPLPVALIGAVSTGPGVRSRQAYRISSRLDEKRPVNKS